MINEFMHRHASYALEKIAEADPSTDKQALVESLFEALNGLVATDNTISLANFRDGFYKIFGGNHG